MTCKRRTIGSLMLVIAVCGASFAAVRADYGLLPAFVVPVCGALLVRWFGGSAILGGVIFGLLIFIPSGIGNFIKFPANLRSYSVVYTNLYMAVAVFAALGAGCGFGAGLTMEMILFIHKGKGPSRSKGARIKSIAHYSHNLVGNGEQESDFS